MTSLRPALAGWLAVVVTISVGCSRRLEPEPARADDPPPADSRKPDGPAATEPPVPPAATEQEPPPREVRKVVAPKDLEALNLEVNALEMLYQFQLTRAQLEQLAKIAPATAADMPAARPIEVTPEYHAALKELHAALAENDDDRVAEASKAMEKLRAAADSPAFEGVDLTEAARTKTPDVLRKLTPLQVTSYLVDFADEFPDPREKIVEALEAARKPGREWESLTRDIAGQVGWLIGGLDPVASEKVSSEVTQLINRAHALKDEEFAAKRAELEKSIDAIVAAAGPTDVIRHFVERSLAELLSNPRLAEAVKLRLQEGE